MKIKGYVDTGRGRREQVLEIDDTELEGLSGDEVAEYADEVVRDWMAEIVDWGWDHMEPGER